MQDGWCAPGRLTGLLGRTALVSLALFLPQSFSRAEVLDPLRGYAMDGSPIGPQRAAPRGHDNPVREEGGDERPQRPAFVSANRIRNVAARQGYNLASTPRRHGRIYVVMAEKEPGHRFELIFSAANGTLLTQKDLGVTVAAKPAAKVEASQPEPAPSPAPDQQLSDTQQAADLSAARAELEKAATAQDEARHLLEARASDLRHAQAKVVEAETTARRLAQSKVEEAKRVAEQKRAEERVADAKRRALAKAEAKLAQAKSLQDRAEAETKAAEAEAAKARLDVAPAVMAGQAAKPAEMVSPPPQASQPATASRDPQAPNNETTAATLGSAPPPPAEATTPPPETTAPSPASATADAGAPASAETPDAGHETGKAAAADAAPAQKAADNSAPSADAVDQTPTGSTHMSPPEPYAAPAPDEAGAQ